MTRIQNAASRKDRKSKDEDKKHKHQQDIFFESPLLFDDPQTEPPDQKNSLQAPRHACDLENKSRTIFCSLSQFAPDKSHSPRKQNERDGEGGRERKRKENNTTRPRQQFVARTVAARQRGMVRIRHGGVALLPRIRPRGLEVDQWRASRY